MANNDGHKEEQRVKKCPFSGSWCIKEECALWAEMTRQAGGLQQKFGMCSFNAVITILSEISMKTRPPQQKINIPTLVRG